MTSLLNDYAAIKKSFKTPKTTFTRIIDYRRERGLNRKIFEALLRYSTDSDGVASKITGLWDEKGFKGLDHLAVQLRTFLTLVKATGGKTPQTSATNSAASSSASTPKRKRRNPKGAASVLAGVSEALTKNIGRDRSLKDICMVRDGYQCVVTGYRWVDTPDEVKKDTDVFRDGLIGAHILPFSLVKLESEFHTSFAETASLFDAPQLDVATLDNVRNIITLNSDVHVSFARFSFAVLCDTADDGTVQYKIDYLTPVRFQPHEESGSRNGKSGDVLFLDGNHDLRPDPAYFRLHELIGRVLHASGFGEIVNRVLEDEQGVDPLAEDVVRVMRQFMEEEAWVTAYVGVEA
ncbi:hypothetical protein HK104_008255 [Borealophlyctis nickersoniae]|nr:hypothetical protein HK104_008255 [Borealophlyctis nickersoniae]